MNRVPDAEYRFEFSRSGGAGGQNVNKVSSRVTLRWNVRASEAFSDSQKLRIENSDAVAGRINMAGEVVIHEQRSRAQLENKQLAVEKLNELVTAALKRRRPRKRSGTPKAQRELRLKAKKHRTERLQSRRF